MLKTVYDFGQAFAQELSELYGQVLPMRTPYPSIPDEWQERMDMVGLNDPDEAEFWQGYNEWYG